MSPLPSRNELISAYQILFGTPAVLTEDFFSRIEPSTLKVAYRKKALETHPDRCRIVGKSETEMSHRFREISIAYECLKLFADGNQNIRINRPPPKPARDGARSNHARTRNRARRSPFQNSFNADLKDHFYSGAIPNRNLKIGQFLYYSRIISWRNLIHAILWQKKQRPLFGKIALDWGFLSANDIRYILASKPYYEKFGEYAKRHGFLTPFQQLAVMGKQRMHQPLFGRYFLENGLLDENRLMQTLRRMNSHNQEIRQREFNFWKPFPGI